MRRFILCAGLVMIACGCSQGDASSARPSTPASQPAEDVAAKLQLPPAKPVEPDLKFNSQEEEIAYWEQKIITESVRRFEKLDKAAVQKRFDDLSPTDKANIERIRTWLPHKRIKEMSNVDEDVTMIASNPDQFDTALAIKRLLEYGDESGSYHLLKNLGVTKPKAIVIFRMEFGQVTPDIQTIIWGVTQKVAKEGMGSLTGSERILLQNRRGLFPTLYPQ
jgi:hypothetical protein